MMKIHELLRNEDGATIVEMGLIAPILATFIIGSVDLSMGFSEKLGLEQAAHRGVERVMQQRSVSDDYSDLTPEVAAAAGVEQNQVTIDYWLECNDVRQDAGVTECLNATDIYARYVEVEVEDTYSPFLGSKWLGANDDGTYTIVGTAGVRIQ